MKTDKNPRKGDRNTFQYCKQILIRMQEIFAIFTKASSARKFLSAISHQMSVVFYFFLKIIFKMKYSRHEPVYTS